MSSVFYKPLYFYVEKLEFKKKNSFIAWCIKIIIANKQIFTVLSATETLFTKTIHSFTLVCLVLLTTWFIIVSYILFSDPCFYFFSDTAKFLYCSFKAHTIFYVKCGLWWVSLISSNINENHDHVFSQFFNNNLKTQSVLILLLLMHYGEHHFYLIILTS